ncbi:hypothetical protein, partial [Achromobacter ruhlandii]|uniref:hypothetical protein n=1 Tax=Achromobacter ruhlandii TaxID=72557 RepID=UPI001B8C806B
SAVAWVATGSGASDAAGSRARGRRIAGGWHGGGHAAGERTDGAAWLRGCGPGLRHALACQGGGGAGDNDP